QPAPQNRLRIMVADIKSSRQERNSHRLQVAIYAKLLQQTAESVGRPIDQIKGSILHLQENDVLPQLEPDQPSFNLTDYNQTLRQLVTSPNSITQRLAASQLDQVEFEIGPWCDQCVYNALCAVNSFQQRDLSLIPHLNLWQKRTLQNVGLKTPGQVAKLTEYQDNRLVPRQPDIVDRLRQQRSINQDLDLVV
ncbi:MAG: PD-(D/E)XK nuclease family protein, partial [Candidatus Poribacteria bacterium]|nr:PD-(D/E)XK nuclease family protein [Candidatus Poribacteria bacterium]